MKPGICGRAVVIEIFLNLWVNLPQWVYKFMDKLFICNNVWGGESTADFQWTGARDAMYSARSGTVSYKDQ